MSNRFPFYLSAVGDGGGQNRAFYMGHASDTDSPIIVRTASQQVVVGQTNCAVWQPSGKETWVGGLNRVAVMEGSGGGEHQLPAVDAYSPNKSCYFIVFSSKRSRNDRYILCNAKMDDRSVMSMEGQLSHVPVPGKTGSLGGMANTMSTVSITKSSENKPVEGYRKLEIIIDQLNRRRCWRLHWVMDLQAGRNCRPRLKLILD